MHTEDEVSQAVAKLTTAEKKQLLSLLELQNERTRYCFRDNFFTDHGQNSRKNYKAQIEFMNKGAEYKERILFGGNRSGKSFTASYEIMCHLTGDYPSWWEGRRFYKATTVWVAGTTGQKTAESLQPLLIGPITDLGSGLIPKANLLTNTGEFKMTTAPGIPGAKKDVYVRHKSGGWSLLSFKSHEQDREAFEANAIDVVWLDEEAPVDIYAECLMRTMTTKGIVLLTFTPLKCLTELVLRFLPDGKYPDTADNCGPVEGAKTKWVSRIAWKNAPHLTEEEKDNMRSSFLPHELEAREHGIVSVGSGLVYPISEEAFTVFDFDLPPHWPRVVGFDVGWKTSAAVWGAYDKNNDCIYIYKEYRVENQLPVVHAAALRQAGAWIPIVVDPAASSLRIRKDGPSMLNEYYELGLEMYKADNSVDVGILTCLNRLSTSRLKVFKSCVKLLNEFRIYARDDKNIIIKRNDDLLDAMRYLCMSGLRIADTEPQDNDDSLAAKQALKNSGRNSITGY